MAFKESIRRIIKGTEHLQSQRKDYFGRTECSHINHDRNSGVYNDPENGREVNLAEHFMEHLVCAREEIDNGLTPAQNKWAAKQIWNRMDEDERDYVRMVSQME